MVFHKNLSFSFERGDDRPEFLVNEARINKSISFTLIAFAKAKAWRCVLGAAHSAMFEFSLLAHILQILLASKINSHISSNFCSNHRDGSWIIKALNGMGHQSSSQVDLN